MNCVWQSPMTSIWALLEMQSILGNFLRWATRVLRPSISSQISRWRLRKDDTSGFDQMFEDSGNVAQDKGATVHSHG